MTGCSRNVKKLVLGFELTVVEDGDEFHVYHGSRYLGLTLEEPGFEVLRRMVLEYEEPGEVDQLAKML